METQVLIIGGGITGAGLFRDLALRGISCVLIEAGDFNSGASGANHGLLHSGARYVKLDTLSAAQCSSESLLLKGLAGFCIENCGGLFAAVKGDDEAYISEFPDLCEKCLINAVPVSIEEAREREPSLACDVIAVFAVEDAVIDPFSLTFNNIADGKSQGGQAFFHHKVIELNIDNKKIKTVRVRKFSNNEEFSIEPEVVVNAAGAWSSVVAGLAGIELRMLYSKGTLLVSDHRIARGVINRLRPDSDGDLLVPGGTVSILGTTSSRVDGPDNVLPTRKEANFLVEELKTLVPALESTRFIRAYSGVRPLVGPDVGMDDRAVARGYALYDHAEEGLANFITITGGKLTTYRLMAEKAADLVCRKLGVDLPCLTRTTPLRCFPGTNLTKPGFSARSWFAEMKTSDIPFVCECEMVPSASMDSIANTLVDNQISPITIPSVSRRSRIGKGQCQGMVCGCRAMVDLVEKKHIEKESAVFSLCSFIESRWKGETPVLWNGQLAQANLKEAVYCGFYNLELPTWKNGDQCVKSP